MESGVREGGGGNGHADDEVLFLCGDSESSARGWSRRKRFYCREKR